MHKFLNIIFAFSFLITQTNHAFAVQKINPMASLEMVRDIGVNSKTFREFSEKLIEILPSRHQSFFKEKLGETDQVKNFSVKIVSNILRLKINNEEITLSPKDPHKGMYFLNGKAIRINLALSTQEIINEVQKNLNQKHNSLFNLFVPNSYGILLAVLWYGLIIAVPAAMVYVAAGCNSEQQEIYNNNCFKAARDFTSSLGYSVKHGVGDLKDIDPKCSFDKSTQRLKSFSLGLMGSDSRSIQVQNEDKGLRFSLSPKANQPNDNQPISFFMENKDPNAIQVVKSVDGTDITYDLKASQEIEQVTGIPRSNLEGFAAATRQLGNIISMADMCCIEKQRDRNFECSLYRKSIRDTMTTNNPLEQLNDSSKQVN